MEKRKEIVISIIIMIAIGAGIISYSRFRGTEDLRNEVIVLNSENQATTVKDVVEITAPPEKESHEEALTFESALSVIIENCIEGYYADGLKARCKKEYDYITRDDESIQQLTMKLDELKNVSEEAINLNLYREKIAVEWLISEMIKSHREKGKYIQKNYKYAVVTNNECAGRIMPNTESEVWTNIPEHSVILTTGTYDDHWAIGQLIAEGNSGTEDSSYYADRVEFWINTEDIMIFEYKDVERSEYNSVYWEYAQQFDYIINDETPDGSGKGDDYVVMHRLPNAQSDALGFLEENDLICIQKDEEYDLMIIDDWALMGQFMQEGEESPLGWIETKYIERLTEASKGNQGYVLMNTKMTENIDGTSSEEYKDFVEVALADTDIRNVKILEREGDMTYINFGVNTFAGWVKETDIYYHFNADVMSKIHNSHPDLHQFVDALKDDILNGTDFVIEARDVEKTKQLSDKEREILADSIQVIDEYEHFDGGVTWYREAIYPYYVLNFGEYEMALTWDKRLLLSHDIDMKKYGIYNEYGPMVWVTPNSEFLETIRNVYPIEANNEDKGFIYLLESDEITIYKDLEKNIVEHSKYQMHINKCVRALNYKHGEEITVEDPDQDIDEVYEYEFTFADGSKKSIIHTNRYIMYDGKYYESLESPMGLMGGLVAAYF